MSDSPPTFATFEEMQEWLENQSSSVDEASTSTSTGSPETKKKGTSTLPKKKSTKGSASSKKKTKIRADESQKIISEFDKEVWSTVHFYKREGDTLAVVRNDAKEEAEFRNSNVLVFYHDHAFGEACVGGCAGVRNS